MVVIYLSIGVILIGTSLFKDVFVNYRSQLGCVFLCYGTFRAVVAFQQYKKSTNQDENQDQNQTE